MLVDPTVAPSIWQHVVLWLSAYGVGDIASVLGVGISLVGFWITVRGVRKSKSAAESARQAAESTRDDIRLLETIVDFSSAIAALEDIKRRHREPPSEILLERYASLRKLLVTIRAGFTDLTDKQQSAIQSSITNLSAFEKRIEKSIGEAKSIPKLNAIVSEDIDGLVEVLTEIKATRSGRQP